MQDRRSNWNTVVLLLRDSRTARRPLVAYRERAHERLGFGSYVEYVERLLGYGPRTALDRLRVAEALERLPELD